MTKNGSNGKVRNGLVAALDIGSTKVACCIARAGAERGLNVVGVGHQISRGIRSGAIVDMEAAAECIRATVETAEQMAGENIRQAVVNLSAGEPKSRLIAYEISIAGHEINDADLRQVLDPAVLNQGRPADHETIHVLPVGYSIDGNRGVSDPRGMFGERLGANVHVVSAGGGALRNLSTCMAHCHLEIESKVISPFASALACLVEDEKKLGVTLIDMGGGTTTIAVYFDGELVHTDSVPVGGIHVTNDIARGLSTPVAHAERMKTLYGSAVPSPSDDREILKVPLIGEDDDGETNPVPRSMLVGIIRPRIEETFEMVRARLEETGFDKVAGRRVTLTGGASQLPGVRDVAGMILGKQIRLGKPRAMRGLAEATSGPAFSTCAGLIRFAVNNPAVEPSTAYRPAEVPVGRLGRIGQWLRENF
ncbi:MAG: cell division protein FtsA [Rhodospirillales bacterium]|jgi:cell division protein FtsA|nr:cell division protein FtsA [Rhodospirillales bacterium]